MTSTTDRNGRVRNFAFDNDNRLTTETWISGGSTVNTSTFTYDAVGNMTLAANNNGAYTMSYNALNRVTVVNEPFSLTLTFSYDNLGNRTGVQDSLSGVTTSVYDAANQLTTRKFADGTNPWRIDLAYTATHQISTETRYKDLAGSNTVASSTFLYDAVDRVTSITHQNGATSLSSFLYSYDAASRVTGATENGAAKTYTYDNANQLTGDGVNTFTYDGTGNRTNTGYTTSTGNELTASPAATYTYDNEGNVTGKTRTSDGENWTYTFDNKNEMTQVVERTTTALLVSTVNYKYDAFGNRIQGDVTKGSTASSTQYGQDGWKVHLDALGRAASYVGNENWDVWVDVDANGPSRTRYFQGDAVDQNFARVSGSLYWFLTDRQGSTRTIIDNSATVADQISYDGWGNASHSNSIQGGRYLWTGRESDGETGLQYNRARYYDPKVGRWISQDPLGFSAGDSNLYRYVYNKPTNDKDLNGLQDFYSGGSAPIATKDGKFKGQIKVELTDHVKGLFSDDDPKIRIGYYGTNADDIYWIQFGSTIHYQAWTGQDSPKKVPYEPVELDWKGGTKKTTTKENALQWENDTTHTKNP